LRVPNDFTLAHVDHATVNAEVSPPDPIHEWAKSGNQGGEAGRNELHLLDVADESVLSGRALDEDRPRGPVRVGEPHHAGIELVLHTVQDVPYVELGFDPKARPGLNGRDRLVVARDREADLALRNRERRHRGSVSRAAS